MLLMGKAKGKRVYMLCDLFYVKEMETRTYLFPLICTHTRNLGWVNQKQAKVSMSGVGGNWAAGVRIE